MSNEPLSPRERQILLRIAREAIACVAAGKPLPRLELSSLPPHLQEEGAAFVTLTQQGRLRGCIGALQAGQPLALDVQEHAAAAAVEDYRFPPVRQEEVALLEIEISRLTPLQELEYTDAKDFAKATSACGRGCASSWISASNFFTPGMGGYS